MVLSTAVTSPEAEEHDVKMTSRFVSATGSKPTGPPAPSRLTLLCLGHEAPSNKKRKGGVSRRKRQWRKSSATLWQNDFKSFSKTFLKSFCHNPAGGPPQRIIESRSGAPTNRNRGWGFSSTRAFVGRRAGANTHAVYWFCTPCGHTRAVRCPTRPVGPVEFRWCGENHRSRGPVGPVPHRRPQKLACPDVAYTLHWLLVRTR